METNGIFGKRLRISQKPFPVSSSGNLETEWYFLETGLKTSLGNEGVFFWPLVSGLGGFRFPFIHEASRLILPAAFFNQFLFLKSCRRFANGALNNAQLFSNLRRAG
jgi:hypothetical protein